MDDFAPIRPPRPRPAIERMKPYSPPTGSRHGNLRLDFNENTAGCSPAVLRHLKKIASREFLSVYPEYEDARRRIAAFHGVTPEQTLISDGTDEGIHLLVNTYVDAGGEVLIPWPTFPMFRFYVELAGAEPRLVPYREPELDFPLEELLDAVSERTRLVLVANPNNPTGGAIGLEEVEKILLRARNAAVLVDEAYFEFYGVTALDLLPRYPNLFVSRTFSKTYGLAGLRAGCLFSQAENAALVRKGQSPYSVSSLSAACAAEALADQDYISAYVKEALAAREILCKGLAKLRVRYYPSEANFVLVRFGDAAGEVCRKLRERGILIRDRSHEVPGAARITVGKKAQVRKLLAALKEVLAECGC